MNNQFFFICARVYQCFLFFKQEVLNNITYIYMRKWLVLHAYNTARTGLRLIQCSKSQNKASLNRVMVNIGTFASVTFTRA